jgi:hypothetical protein
MEMVFKMLFQFLSSKNFASPMTQIAVLCK